MIQLQDYFTAWPFSVIPDRKEEIVWAGRSAVLSDVRALLASFTYRPQSTLDLVWAAFGAGKTHLLFYLEQQAAKAGKVIPWYSVMPSSARSFNEVYRSLMQSFPAEPARAHLLQGMAEKLPHSDIGPVLQALLLGSSEQKQVARDWLSGLKVDLRSARRLLSIPFKIETADQMQRIFAQVLQALVAAGCRVLLLLDEYQRVQAHHGGTRDLLNAAFLDAFNSIPKGLSIVFSCSSAQQTVAQRVLPPELQDRMRGRKVLVLPELAEAEGVQFLRELVGFFRPNSYTGTLWAPFNERVVQRGVASIALAKNGGLLPRHLIQVFDYALGNAIDSGASEVSEAAVETSVQRVVAKPDHEPT
jgi:hypothetical protein